MQSHHNLYILNHMCTDAEMLIEGHMPTVAGCASAPLV